jgi:hypothetical protein
MATTKLNNFGLPTATKQIRSAVRLDNFLESEAKIIQKMITEWECIESKRNELLMSLSEPGLYPEVILFTNKCVDDISLILDELWKEIREAQARHLKNIRRAQEIVKAIRD